MFIYLLPDEGFQMIFLYFGSSISWTYWSYLKGTKITHSRASATCLHLDPLVFPTYKGSVATENSSPFLRETLYFPIFLLFLLLILHIFFLQP